MFMSEVVSEGPETNVSDIQHRAADIFFSLKLLGTSVHDEVLFSTFRIPSELNRGPAAVVQDGSLNDRLSNLSTFCLQHALLMWLWYKVTTF